MNPAVCIGHQLVGWLFDYSVSQSVTAFGETGAVTHFAQRSICSVKTYKLTDPPVSAVRSKIYSNRLRCHLPRMSSFCPKREKCISERNIRSQTLGAHEFTAGARARNLPAHRLGNNTFRV